MLDLSAALVRREPVLELEWSCLTSTFAQDDDSIASHTKFFEGLAALGSLPHPESSRTLLSVSAGLGFIVKPDVMAGS